MAMSSGPMFSHRRCWRCCFGPRTDILLIDSYYMDVIMGAVGLVGNSHASVAVVKLWRDSPV